MLKYSFLDIKQFKINIYSISIHRIKINYYYYTKIMNSFKNSLNNY